MYTHRRVTQSRTGNRLPGSLDRQLLDLVAHPVEPDSSSDLEIDACGLYDPDFMSRGHLHNIQGSIVRGQSCDARGQLRRYARLHVLLANPLEALPLRAAENVRFRLQLANTLAEFRHGRVDLELSFAMCEQPVGHMAQQ